jgi:hypothetical protein
LFAFIAWNKLNFEKSIRFSMHVKQDFLPTPFAKRMPAPICSQNPVNPVNRPPRAVARLKTDPLKTLLTQLNERK